LSRMRTFFQKSARVVAPEIAIKVKPRVPNLEKCSNLGEKEGVADDFENDPSFRSKPTVPVIPLERF
jgi:hypothetical protein